MKKNVTLLYCILVLSVSITRAQSTLGGNTFINTSLDMITSTESIAMGESFVANNSNVQSYFENPAAIFNRRNVSVFYNYRYQGWMDVQKEAHNFAVGFITRTNIGNFGISVNQFTTGEYNTGAPTGKTEDKNRTLILSYGREVINNFTLGINAKVFDRKLSSTGTSDFQISSNTAFLADIGALYNFNNLINTDEIESQLSLGVSLQNIGTDYKEESRYFLNSKEIRRLPRYLRAGFALASSLYLGKAAKANVEILFTGEYKNLTNPTEKEKLNVDYWSAGIEATLFNIISLRAGALKTPEYNVLFDRNKFNWRYGAGIKIPIGIIGLRYPAMIKFDYATIPVNQLELLYTTVDNPDGTGITEKTKNHLYSFSVTLSYHM